jgi:hypothetical protein
LTPLTLCLSLSSMLLIWSYLWSGSDLVIMLGDTERLKSKPSKCWLLKLNYRTSLLLPKLSLLLCRARQPSLGQIWRVLLRKWKNPTPPRLLNSIFSCWIPMVLLCAPRSTIWFSSRGLINCACNPPVDTNCKGNLAVSKQSLRLARENPKRIL